ncbi:MAG: HPF/RaiA family ribosome-associated protein [Anaerolineae bacterium]|nr:HPF/RaiA family ribosome-associated protein [Anaerolineae bacterium]
MNLPDFDFEFMSEIPDPDDVLRAEALNRLLELAEGHDDIIGASVAVEELTGTTTPHHYQVRVVAFVRPNNIAAVEKDETARGALKGALTAVERQVREQREQLRETWKRP